MPTLLDTTTDWGRSIAANLERDPVIWLTTIRSDGSPWPNPVWFVWDGETFLVYSTPDAAKLAHLRRDPRVTLHLNGHGWEQDIVVAAGEAQESDDPPPNEHAAYAAKYRDLFPRLGLTPEEYGARYSVPLRVAPTSWRGH
jgi:PPOX class probable F420-dependent enzyme